MWITIRERLKRSRGLLAALLLVCLAVGALGGCGSDGSGFDGSGKTAASAAAWETDVGDAAEAEADTGDAAEAETDADDDAAETEADAGDAAEAAEGGDGAETLTVMEDGTYTSKEEVALYLHIYGKLPSNYITKKEAEALGWKKEPGKAGELGTVAPGKSIGGSRFGNYEGALPDADGRQYYECDIDFDGGSRGAKRLVYSNDGLIFYTEDHYETFEQLY